MENQLQKRPRLSSSPLPNRRTHYRFQRGDRCCFFHGNGDPKVAVDGRHELITTDEYENQNPRCNDKTKLCWRFMNGEKCQFGDRCHFSHIIAERKSVAISIVDVAGNVQMLRQTPWKTRLCNRWMSTGSCVFGLKCCFAHGELELQKRGLNNAQDYAEGEACESVDMTCEKKWMGSGGNLSGKMLRRLVAFMVIGSMIRHSLHVENGNLANSV